MSSIPKPTDDYPDSMIEAGLDAYENKDRGDYGSSERYLAHAYMAFPVALRALKKERENVVFWQKLCASANTRLAQVIDYLGKCQAPIANVDNTETDCGECIYCEYWD